MRGGRSTGLGVGIAGGTLDVEWNCRRMRGVVDLVLSRGGQLGDESENRSREDIARIGRPQSLAVARVRLREEVGRLTQS